MTTTTKARKTATVRAFIKSVNEELREVEQIVSVFENVDLGRDRVKAGAFAASLSDWAASGDPIPAIWSHEWDNPFAHIGFVLEAKELLPGDAMLPPEIAELGGLYTKYRVDTAEENAFADQVFRLLKGRRVREASFAYDINKEKKNPDGTTDLIELGLIEIGPTLKGMNPMTQLLAAKSARAAQVAELVKAGLTEDTATAALDAAEAKAATPEDAPDGAKAWVQLAGSLEATAAEFYDVAFDYVVLNRLADGGIYELHQEGTFPDDLRAVYCVEGWNDPYGEGPLLEFHFERDADGALIVNDFTAVTIEANAVPAKGRGAGRKKALSTKTRETLATVTKNDAPSGKTEEPSGAKAEDPDASGNNGEATRVLLATDLLDIDA